MSTSRWVPRSSRPVIMGSHHTISTNHYLASTAGMRILEAGGNAVDAGVAAGMCINVTQPDITNLGGVAPICVYTTAEDAVKTISGLGTWPADARREYFVDEHAGRIPTGPRRSIVPAAVAGWLTALERFGTMSLAEVAAPALELAADGFPVHDLMHESLAESGAVAQMKQWPTTARTYLTEEGTPHPVGTLFTQPELAWTIERLIEAEAGAADRAEGVRRARDRFYRGDLARRMADFSREQGGWLSFEDLAGFDAEVEDALTISYRGHDVYACGPWCQGPTVLQTLNILSGYDIGSLGLRSAELYHLVLEALKAAFADRDRYVGDPRYVDVPIEGLLAPSYGAAWRERIRGEHAHPAMPEPGDPWRHMGITPDGTGSWTPPVASRGPLEPDTSYVSVVDSAGNAFSATPSDGVTTTPLVDGMGIILSGRGGQSWTDPGHPAALEPGKRPRLTPNPGMVRRGSMIMPYGTPGLDVQPQAMVQFLIGVIDFGLDVQSAIELPRCVTYSFPASSDPHPYRPNAVAAEARVGEETIDGLRERGHDVEVWPEWTGTAGAVCAARAEHDRGLFFGGADPRRQAYAIGR